MTKPIERYRPERHYMRGPGPKWLEPRLHCLQRSKQTVGSRAPRADIDRAAEKRDELAPPQLPPPRVDGARLERRGVRTETSATGLCAALKIHRTEMLRAISLGDHQSDQRRRYECACINVHKPLTTMLLGTIDCIL